MTIEELEIIVEANVQGALSEFKKIVPEIKKQVALVKKEFDNFNVGDISESIDTSNIKEKIGKVKEEVKNVFDPEDTSGMTIHMWDDATENAGGYLDKLREIHDEESKGFIKYNPAEIERKINGNVNPPVSSEQAPKEETVSLWEKLKEKIEQVKQSIREAKEESGGMSSKLSGSLNITGKMKTQVKSISVGFKNGLKSVMKYAAAMIGLRTVISFIRQSASAWLSSQNKQAQQLSANLNYMKYALGSTFAPVIEVAINAMYRLLKAVQSVVYALTKVNIFAKATASSMKKASGSAGKASKSLSSVHSEINNISENKSGGGDTSPTLDMTKLDPANAIYEALAKGDFRLAGQMVAEKLNKSMESIDWEKIGSTIANGINKAFEFMYGFLSTFNFRGFGQSASKFINGLFDVDWGLVASTLSEGIKGFFDFITGFFEKLDTKKIWTSIKNFFTGIDWAGVAQSIFRAFGTALGALANFIIEILKDAWNGIKNYFSEWIEGSKEQGGNVVDGILAGIANALINIGKWIYDNMIKPLVDAFCDMLGIHSPSTVFMEFGGYIVQGLLNGISNTINKISEVWNNIKTKCKDGAKNAYDAVTNIFSNIPNWFKNKFSDAWTKVKQIFSSGGKIFDGIKDGILNGLKTVINGIISGINKVISIPFKGINTALTKIKNISIAGIEPFKDKINLITVPQIPQLATGNVAYSPMIAQFGEYAGARNNPEITTPQNIMRETFLDVLGDYFNNQSSNNENSIKTLQINFGSTTVGLDMINLIREAKRQNGLATVTI